MNTETLYRTLNSIESEYKRRERERLEDLSLVLDNTYASKNVLQYSKNFKKSLQTSLRELSTQISDTQEKIQSLSSDITVNEKRFNEFRNNVVAQAEECRFGMDDLYELLQNEHYDLECELNDSSEKERYDKSSMNLTQFTELGTMGLQLSRFKKSIDERNMELESIAEIFRQIRYAHAGQYHANKEAYSLATHFCHFMNLFALFCGDSVLSEKCRFSGR